LGAANGECFVILACTVLIQLTSVTDGRTDRGTDGQTPRRWLRRAMHSAIVRKAGAIFMKDRVILTSDRPCRHDRFPLLSGRAFVEELQMAISQQQIIQFTLSLVLGRVIGVGQFNGVIHIYAQLALVAMVTKFDTKLAMTRLAVAYCKIWWQQFYLYFFLRIN